MMASRKQFKSILAPLVLTLCILLAIVISFTCLTTYAAPGDQKVFDLYGLFTEDEISELEKVSSEYGEEGQVDIVMITTDELDGRTRQQYLEDFYDANGFGYNQEFGDAVLFLINMDPNDRGAEIQGYGQAEYYINNDRIEYMLVDIIPMLSDTEYYDAMVEFAKQVAYYMNQEKGINTSPITGAEGSGNYHGESSYAGDSDYYGEPDPIYFNIFFQIMIALIIGAIAVAVMAYQSGGKITVNNKTYLDEKNSGLVAKQDDYIRTTTTRVRKPSTNNTGGGRSSGGGGVSSGGHSHSGGGRGF